MATDLGTTGSFFSDLLFYGFYGLAFSIVLILMGEMLIRRKNARMDMARKPNGPNDRLMLVFGLGVVLSWVIIASTASYFSIVQEREITDSQLTVIGLLGGPALLMITSVLDLFKGKESAKINILPDQLASDVASADVVCDTDSQTATLTDTGIDLNDPLAVMISATASTPGVVNIHVRYTVDE